MKILARVPDDTACRLSGTLTVGVPIIPEGWVGRLSRMFGAEYSSGLSRTRDYGLISLDAGRRRGFSWYRPTILPTRGSPHRRRILSRCETHRRIRLLPS